MHRRDFLKASGVGLAGLALPFGNVIAAEELLTSLDVGMKKSISDAAMQAARDAGATYCDVRIGRWRRTRRGSGRVFRILIEPLLYQFVIWASIPTDVLRNTPVPLASG